MEVGSPALQPLLCSFWTNKEKCQETQAKMSLMLFSLGSFPEIQLLQHYL